MNWEQFWAYSSGGHNILWKASARTLFWWSCMTVKSLHSKGRADLNTLGLLSDRSTRRNAEGLSLRSQQTWNSRFFWKTVRSKCFTGIHLPPNSGAWIQMQLQSWTGTRGLFLAWQREELSPQGRAANSSVHRSPSWARLKGLVGR